MKCATDSNPSSLCQYYNTIYELWTRESYYCDWKEFNAWFTLRDYEEIGGGKGHFNKYKVNNRFVIFFVFRKLKLNKTQRPASNKHFSVPQWFSVLLTLLCKCKIRAFGIHFRWKVIVTEEKQLYCYKSADVHLRQMCVCMQVKQRKIAASLDAREDITKNKMISHPPLHANSNCQLKI